MFYFSDTFYLLIYYIPARGHWGSIRWPLEVTDDLGRNEWFQTLPDREKEALSF